MLLISNLYADASISPGMTTAAFPSCDLDSFANIVEAKYIPG